MSIYNLSPRIHSAVSWSLSDALDLGFLQRFVDESANLFPRVLLDTRELPPGFGEDLNWMISGLRVFLLQTPRGDPLLIVDAQLDDTAVATDIVAYLGRMHYQRDSIMIGERLLVDWVGEQLEVAERLRIGYAHQMVFAGGPLAQQILAEAPARPSGAVATILQGMAMASSGPDHAGQVGVREPAALNIPGRAFLANSRYATVVAGWSPTVQDALVLVVVHVIGAFCVLRRARSLAFRALEYDLDTGMVTIEDARNRHARLAAELSEIQLDLSFGVEAYVDSVLVPDSRMDSFRASFHDVVGLEAGLAHTSRIVERLGAVVQARSAVLAEASRERQERRDRALSGMLAAGSLLAIPLTLLLGFFGVSSRDVDPGRSMFDLSHYWPAYVGAWVPFGILVLVGVMLRRRVRVASPRGYSANRPDAPLPRPGPAPVDHHTAQVGAAEPQGTPAPT